MSGTNNPSAKPPSRHHNSGGGSQPRTRNERASSILPKHQSPDTPRDRPKMTDPFTTKEQLEEIKTAIEKTYKEWIVPKTQYNLLDHLRKAVIAHLKAQSDAEEAQVCYENVQREAAATGSGSSTAKSKQVRAGLKAAEKLLVEYRGHANEEKASVREAYQSFNREWQRTGFGTGENHSHTEPTPSIVQFTWNISSTLTDIRISISDEIVVLALLNTVMNSLKKILATYDPKATLEVQSEYEELPKEYGNPQSTIEESKVIEQITNLHLKAKGVEYGILRNQRDRIRHTRAMEGPMGDMEQIYKEYRRVSAR